MAKRLSDLHNFGRYVYFAEDNYVFKPRFLGWEEFFLSYKSPLRSYFKASTNKNEDPFFFFPLLRFKNISNIDIPCGYIEKVSLTQSQTHENLYIEKAVGNLIAIVLWFGLSDLHFENIFSGFDKNNNYFCFPIDIEIVFGKISLLSNTLLFPDSEEKDQLHGTKNLGSKIKNPAIVISSFLNTIDTLSKNKDKIFEIIIKNIVPEKFPVRYVIRATKEYYNFIQKNQHQTYFINEEIIQLNRNDIPYFFTFLNSRNIFYYTSSYGSFDIVESKLDLDCNYSPMWKKNKPELQNHENIDLIKLTILQFLRSLKINDISRFESENVIICRIGNFLYFQEKKLLWKLKCHI